jgi:hypothetical protein
MIYCSFSQPKGMAVCGGRRGAVQTLNFTVNRVIWAMGEGADQAGRLPSTNK